MTNQEYIKFVEGLEGIDYFADGVRDATNHCDACEESDYSSYAHYLDYIAGYNSVVFLVNDNPKFDILS